jgi:peptidyl-prolyl cis-trans isomerase SurA
MSKNPARLVCLVALASAAAFSGVHAQGADPGAPELIGPAARPAPVAADGVAAIVNDQVISTWDVRQRATFVLLSSGIPTTPENIERARPQALNSLIDEQIQILEGKVKYKAEVTDEEVDEQLNEIARGNGVSTEKFIADLRAAGVSATTLRTQIRAETIWRRIVGGRFGQRVRISEEQITDTLNRMSTNISKPQFQVSEIFIPALTPAEFSEAEAGAGQLIEQIRRGAPFQLVARQFSSAPSAAAGGDLGWLPLGQMRPELQAVVERMPIGSVSEPVRTLSGVYVLALRNKRAGATPVEKLGLKQVMMTGPDGLQKLTAARGALGACQGLETNAPARAQGSVVIDLGEVIDTDLTPDFRSRLAGVPVGGATEVFQTAQGAATLVVCGRAMSVGPGMDLPSRREISEQLFQQQIGLLAQRYLNNLRREATIIRPSA